MDYQTGKTFEEVLANQAILNNKLDELLKRIPKPKGAKDNDKED